MDHTIDGCEHFHLPGPRRPDPSISTPILDIDKSSTIYTTLLGDFKEPLHKPAAPTWTRPLHRLEKRHPAQRLPKPAFLLKKKAHHYYIHSLLYEVNDASTFTHSFHFPSQGTFSGYLLFFFFFLTLLPSFSGLKETTTTVDGTDQWIAQELRCIHHHGNWR